jgi:hypothetical protein
MATAAGYAAPRGPELGPEPLCPAPGWQRGQLIRWRLAAWAAASARPPT